MCKVQKEWWREYKKRNWKDEDDQWVLYIYAIIYNGIVCIISMKQHMNFKLIYTNKKTKEKKQTVVHKE